MLGNDRHWGSMAYRSPASRAVFALVIAASLGILFAPESSVPSGLPEGTDKVVHVSLFAALCLSGLYAGVRHGLLAGVLVTYALASELIQASPLLGRSASGWDVLADVAGIAAGLALARRRAWGKT